MASEKAKAPHAGLSVSRRCREHLHDSRAAALTWLSKRYDPFTLAKISGHVDINELYNTYYRESAVDVAARL